MQEPEISVVIPTYHREDQLAEAIDSVLAQDVVAQIIVMDDSPEGSAGATAARFPQAEVCYAQHRPPSRGRPALVRNAGAPLARAPFVHFLDDDDRVATGFYRSALDTFARHPDIGLVFGRVEPFTSRAGYGIQHERDFFATATRRARLASRLRSRLWLTASLLFLPTVLANSACIVRRECIAQVGGYDASLDLNEDVDFHTRVAREFGYRFLDRVVLNYRISPDSLMHGHPDDGSLAAAYRAMHAHYRARHGDVEFLAMKLLARTVMRFV